MRPAPERERADFRPIRICYLDAELRYRHCNAPYVNWVNQPREWVLGRHVREILGDVAFEIVEKYFTRALAGETVTYEEEILHTPAGCNIFRRFTFPILTMTAMSRDCLCPLPTPPVFLEAEKALEAEIKDPTERLQPEAEGFQGLEDFIHRDILNRLKAIHGARRHQEFIGDMPTNIAEAVATIDQRGIIETFNPSAERMFGYSAVEAVRRNVRILMPEPCHGEHDGYLRSYPTTGKSKILNVGSRQVTAKRKDGPSSPWSLASVR